MKRREGRNIQEIDIILKAYQQSSIFKIKVKKKANKNQTMDVQMNDFHRN